MNPQLLTCLAQVILKLNETQAFRELCADARADPGVAGPTLARLAARYWNYEGADPADYCVQHATCECVIFGGRNRVVWHPGSGFALDEGLSTSRFRDAFAEVGPQANDTKQLLEEVPSGYGTTGGGCGRGSVLVSGRKLAHQSRLEKE